MNLKDQTCFFPDIFQYDMNDKWKKLFVSFLGDVKNTFLWKDPVCRLTVQIIILIEKQIDRYTLIEEQIDRYIDRIMDGWIDRQIYEYIYWQLDRQIYEYIGSQINRQVNKQIERQTNKWNIE